MSAVFMSTVTRAWLLIRASGATGKDGPIRSSVLISVDTVLTCMQKVYDTTLRTIGLKAVVNDAKSPGQKKPLRISH